MVRRRNGDVEPLHEYGPHLIGKRLKTKFPGEGYFTGKVTDYDNAKDRYQVHLQTGNASLKDLVSILDVRLIFNRELVHAKLLSCQTGQV